VSDYFKEVVVRGEDENIDFKELQH
jgi:hypothetical protein